MAIISPSLYVGSRPSRVRGLPLCEFGSRRHAGSAPADVMAVVRKLTAHRDVAVALGEIGLDSGPGR